MKRMMLLVLAVALAVPAGLWAQGTSNFSGTWKLNKIDPERDPRLGPDTGRGGRGRGEGGGGGGRGGDAYNENTFSAAPQTVIITQTANQVTVQVGSVKEVYTMDNKLTVAPAGDVNALKTWAHWDGTTLHLHHKQAMSFGRDALKLNGANLVVQRDLETGGQSTTRTLTYTKTS